MAPVTICEFCCNPLPWANSDITFKQAVLLALCGVSGTFAPASEAATSNVASSATVVDILAANSARKGVAIFNDSSQILKIKYGSGASSTDFTYQIAAGATFNMVAPIYTGLITGIWASANGFARVTELT